MNNSCYAVILFHSAFALDVCEPAVGMTHCRLWERPTAGCEDDPQPAVGTSHCRLWGCATAAGTTPG
jgi:hypothetical protein